MRRGSRAARARVEDRGARAERVGGARPERPSGAVRAAARSVLAASLLAGCSEELARDLDAVPTYAPTTVDFGRVAVSAQATAEIEVTAGSRSLRLVSVVSSGAKFQFKPSEALRAGLGPGRTGVLEVRYRPCPEAWDEERLRPGFDPTGCASGADHGAIDIVDDSPAPVRSLRLSGTPSPAPRLDTRCDDGPCAGFVLGPVALGGSAQARIDVLNVAPEGAAPLHVLGASLRARRDGVETEPAELGLRLDAGADAPVPTGGRRTLTIDYAPVAPGPIELVLALETDDPGAQPAAELSLRALAEGGALAAAPPRIELPRTAAARAPLRIDNTGNAAITVTAARFTDGRGLRLEAALPTTIPAGGGADWTLDYDGGAEPREDALVLSTDASDGAELTVPIVLTPVPAPCADPARLTVSGEVADVVISNCGDAELELRRIELVGPDGDPAHASAVEFGVEGCPNRSCTPSIFLCSRSDPACSRRETTLHVVHTDRDGSGVDEALLRIDTSAPLSPRLEIPIVARRR